jgi:hypothetical protein
MPTITTYFPAPVAQVNEKKESQEFREVQEAGGFARYRRGERIRRYGFDASRKSACSSVRSIEP